MWPFTSGGDRPYSDRRKNERDLKLDYFAHVIADFHRLSKRAREDVLVDLPPSLRGLVEQVAAQGRMELRDEAQLDWGEIATLEDKFLARDDDAGIRRRAWQIRQRYARLSGPERYQAYLASGPPDPNDTQTTPGALLADLRRLLAGTHFTYSMAMVRENNRRRVLRKLLWWTAGLLFPLLVASGSLIGFTNGELAGLLCIVAFFGCLGAYVSIQRRLQNTADGGDPVIGILALHEFNAVQRFPLIAGGVFAVVLYLILAGKFMTGSLFPTLGTNGIPMDMENWAKLLIWSFIAGFAERLVPDALDRLVNQAQQASEATPMAAASTGTPSPKPLTDDAKARESQAATRAAKLLEDFHTKAPTPPPV